MNDVPEWDDPHVRYEMCEWTSLGRGYWKTGCGAGVIVTGPPDFFTPCHHCGLDVLQSQEVEADE